MTPQRGFLRQSPPQDFAFTTSVSVGMRDAIEVIAHEMIHISQMCYGRMRVQKRRVGAGMSARQIHIVSWCRTSRHQSTRLNGTNGLGKSRHVTGRRSWLMSFLSGPAARCRPSRFKSTSLINWPCIDCQKIQRQQPRVHTCLNRAPSQLHTGTTEKPITCCNNPGDNRLLNSSPCLPQTARLRLPACDPVTVSGRR